jgi:hypothetical protein
MKFNSEFEPPIEGTPAKRNGVIKVPEPAPSRPIARVETLPVIEELRKRQAIKLLQDGLDRLGRANFPQAVIDDVSSHLGHMTTKEEQDGLPPIRKLGDFIELRPATPPELIQGVLHQGSKMVLGGGSKSFKTWSLIDLGLSVAAGAPWWEFTTTKGKVLYLNLEVQDCFFLSRVEAICKAKLISLPSENFHIWGLRGFAANIDKLLPEILNRIKDEKYALIIIDPIYKIYGDRDENAAGDIAGLMNALEKIAVETGASICFGAHFAKGNASAKEAIDRVAGSGVFSRDPDSLVNLTRHEEEDCFTVDCILRNFPQVKPFVVKFAVPLMTRQRTLDPKKLKQIGGSPKLYSPEDLLSCLEGELTLGQWKEAVSEQTGMKDSCFFAQKKVLVEKDLVIQDIKTKKWSKKTSYSTNSTNSTN